MAAACQGCELRVGRLSSHKRPGVTPALKRTFFTVHNAGVELDRFLLGEPFVIDELVLRCVRLESEFPDFAVVLCVLLYRERPC